jgi:hypothetical protein
MQPKRNRRLLVLSLMGLVPLVVSAATAIGANSPTISVAFSPATFDYGPVTANTTAQHTYVLTNSGTKATGTIKVDLTDSNPDEVGIFSTTADTCTGSKLSPKKSRSVTVQYAPTTTGSHSAASLFARDIKPSTTFNALATILGGVSAGCATVNAPSLDGSYVSFGSQAMAFKAGETLTLSAGDPSAGGATGISLTVGAVESDVPYPGTVQYTIPADGNYVFGWTTQPAVGATWTANCG